MGMRINFSTAEELEKTRIKAVVFPFWPDKSVALTVRGGRVEIIGCADFTPAMAKAFAIGIERAACVAEGTYVEVATN